MKPYDGQQLEAEVQRLKAGGGAALKALNETANLKISRLEAEVQHLRDECANLKSYIVNTEAAEKWYLDGEITWKEFATAMEAENQRLREALETYGEHSWDCAYHQADRCTCGFEQADNA